MLERKQSRGRLYCLIPGKEWLKSLSAETYRFTVIEATPY